MPTKTIPRSKETMAEELEHCEQAFKDWDKIIRDQRKEIGEYREALIKSKEYYEQMRMFSSAKIVDQLLKKYQS